MAYASVTNRQQISLRTPTDCNVNVTNRRNSIIERL